MGWGGCAINLMPKDKMRPVTMSHIVTWIKNVDGNQVSFIFSQPLGWSENYPFFPVGENKQKLEK